MTMTRSEAAKVAANTRWAFEPDRSKATVTAREALLARFAREVDPDGRLSQAERDKRVKNAMAAHMTRMRAARRTRRRSTTRT